MLLQHYTFRRNSPHDVWEQLVAHIDALRISDCNSAFKDNIDAYLLHSLFGKPQTHVLILHVLVEMVEDVAQQRGIRRAVSDAILLVRRRVVHFARRLRRLPPLLPSHMKHPRILFLRVHHPQLLHGLSRLGVVVALLVLPAAVLRREGWKTNRDILARPRPNPLHAQSFREESSVSGSDYHFLAIAVQEVDLSFEHHNPFVEARRLPGLLGGGFHIHYARGNAWLPRGDPAVIFFNYDVFRLDDRVWFDERGLHSVGIHCLDC
mmetsp:Transcript_21502/g.38138  ORF Transcript_21502/g.38138 Transcript_21502/m.38138 type:complete len:264 (-) Transcript_21502:2-793(-)